MILLLIFFRAPRKKPRQATSPVPCPLPPSTPLLQASKDSARTRAYLLLNPSRFHRIDLLWIVSIEQLGLTSQPQLFKEPELTMFALVKTLKTAAHDPRIKGVLMKFDGPALSMAATMEVERRLRRLFRLL